MGTNKTQRQRKKQCMHDPSKFGETTFINTVLKLNPAAWEIYRRFIYEREAAREDQGLRMNTKRVKDWWDGLPPRQHTTVKLALDEDEGGVPLPEDIDDQSSDLSHGPEPVFVGSNSEYEDDDEEEKDEGGKLKEA
ncbi:MAG: hypothetical protein Q9208_006058 [Pyrenodesmia sp. 3 TL-2023]